MQEYRINYTLLIGLLVGTLVCSGAIYGIHKLQTARQSGWLLSEAEKANSEKDFRDAVLNYQQYVTIHTDDKPSRIKLANALLDLIEQEDVAPEDLGPSIQSLETVLRNPLMADVPEMKDVRKRLVMFYGRDNIHNYDDALAHLSLLLESDPNNIELQVLRATYLAKSGNVKDAIKYSYSLIGFDPKKEDFDAKKAMAPHEVEVYALLSGILRAKENRPDLAERVANKMVEANSKDAAAYVARGRLRAMWRDAAGSKADSESAYKLKPNDSDVLLLAADMAAQNKDLTKAREYLTTAKKLHPKESRLYQRAAAIEMQDNKLDKAKAELDAGAQAVGGAAAINLLFVKARLQIESNDLKGARQTIDDMQKLRKLVPEVSEYFEAMFLVAEGKWYLAVEALSRLRPRVAMFGKEMSTEIDFDLALCYERLGRFEQALQYYEQIVQEFPQNAPAVAGVQRMKNMLGKKIDTGGSGDSLQAKMMEILKKPKAEQDWSSVYKDIEVQSEKNKLEPTTVLLAKAQIAMLGEDYEGAAKFLSEANRLAPKNLQINRFKVQLARLHPKVGPEKAMNVLETVVKEFGDQPALRLDKADILITLNKDKQDKQPLKQQLAELATNIDTWSAQQKSDLYKGLSDRCMALNMLEEARQYLSLAADNQPNELRWRLALFSLALDANDAEGMKSAQDKILQIVGDQNDSDWLAAEARRQLWLLRRGQLSKDALADIRGLVKRALDQRSENADLYALLAEVELMSNNAALALKYYDQAEELGRPVPTAVAQHIRLLTDVGRFTEAGKLLERLPEAARQPLLGLRYAEILFRTDQVEAALKQAQSATESDPTSAANQYWYGQLLARSSQDPKLKETQRKETLGKAVAAMQKATELQPEFPDAWFSLINYYKILDNENAAHKAMRDAQLVLSGDNLTLFLAKSYEALNRWFDAETMYREIYEIDPNDLPRAQQLAAFYLGPLYPRADRKEKATPLLNVLLKGGAEGKLAPNDSNLLWARRTAAKLLAGTGDYQNLRKAENLLASNSQDGSLLIEDKLAMAEILAPRPEPISKRKAIALLEEIDKVQPLNEPAAVQLGELYFTTQGDWSKYSSWMDRIVAKFPKSVRARDAYSQRLIARGDQSSIERAMVLVREIQTISPNYPAIFDLTVRIANKSGKQKQVRDQLVRRLPNFAEIKEIDPALQQTLIRFAGLLVELKDVETAEKIYRELAARDPKFNFELARFVGLQRSPEECFAKLKELYSVDRINDVLSVAVTVARDRRDKVGDKFDAQIQNWLDAGLRENPDSITLLVTQADIYDLQKRYDDAANVYRKLLERNDLVGLRRAVVLNNLAYLVALAGKSAKTDVDPMKLVVEAVQILGPNSDILDTRAVVYMSRQQFKEAIADLDLSVTDGPTASKYFHKAVAHLRASESRNALAAWQKAEGLGLNRDALNRMEHELYESAKKEIDKIRVPAVTKSETLRKAG
jgi:tetratricopeptide (TPR) repeat protein